VVAIRRMREAGVHESSLGRRQGQESILFQELGSRRKGIIMHPITVQYGPF